MNLRLDKRRGLSRLNKQILMGVLCATILTFVTYSALTSTWSQNDEMLTSSTTRTSEKMGRGHFIDTNRRNVKNGGRGGGGVATNALAGAEYGVMGGMRQPPEAAISTPIENLATESAPVSVLASPPASPAILPSVLPPKQPVLSTPSKAPPSKQKIIKTIIEEADGIVKKTTIVEELTANMELELEDLDLPAPQQDSPHANIRHVPKYHSTNTKNITKNKKPHPPPPRPRPPQLQSPQKKPQSAYTNTKPTSPGFTNLPVSILLSASTFAVFFGVSVARHIRHKGLMRDCIENEPYDDVRFKANIVNELGEPIGYPPTYGTVNQSQDSQRDTINFIDRAMSYGSASFRGQKQERFDV